MPISHRFISILLLLSAPIESLADDSTEEHTDTAEGDIEVIHVVSERDRARVAGSAYILNEEQLEMANYDNVHQVLSTIPGVYVRTEDGFGLRPNIGMRGASSDRSAKIMLLEDGLPMAPAPYGAPAAYYFPLVTRMAAVEIIKGPASIKYGPQTIGGAINFVTRKIPEEASGAVDLAYGSYGTLRTHGYGGTGTDTWGVLLEATHLSSDGFKVIDGGGDAGFFRQDMMLKLRVGPPEGYLNSHSVDIKFGFVREQSHGGYLGLSAADFADNPHRLYAASRDDLMAWDRKSAEMTWRINKSSDLKWRTSLYYHQFARVWGKLNGFGNGVSIHDLLMNPDSGQNAVYMAILKGEEASSGLIDHMLIRGTNDRKYRNMGLQSVGTLALNTGNIRHDLEIGARLHRDTVTRLHIEDGFNMSAGGDMLPSGIESTTTLDSASSVDAISGYLHDDIDVGLMRILPGIRVEHYRAAAGDTASGPVDPIDRAIVLPGLGAFASLTSWIDLLAGIHRGFSPVPPGSEPELDAEVAWNYEGGLRVHGRGIKGDVVGFYSDYQNIAGQCTLSSGCTDANLGQQFNGGQARVYGVEQAFAYELTALAPLFKLEGTYTYTQAEFRSDFVSEFDQFGEVNLGDMLPYVPTHQGSLGLSMLHERGMVSLALSGRSEMRDVAGTEEDGEAEIPSMYTLDGATNLKLGTHWNCYFSVTNITDYVSIESWRPYGARPGAPRQIMAGIKGDF